MTGCNRDLAQCLGAMLIGLFSSFLSAVVLAEEEGRWRYDFGAAKLAPAAGYMRLDATALYSAERGFGLLPSPGNLDRGVRHRRLAADRRLDTFVFDDGGTTFVQDLPNGVYYVSLAAGDAAYPSTVSIALNGVSLQLLGPTRRGEMIFVNGARVKVSRGQLRVEAGGWGQLCYLEIIAADSQAAAEVRATDGTRQLVSRLAVIPEAPRKTDAANEARWVCIGPWYFPGDGIWIVPVFDKALLAGQREIVYGWSLVLHLPDEERYRGAKLMANVDLVEADHTEDRVVERTLFQNRTIPLTLSKLFQTRPSHHYTHEAQVTLLEPFQQHLKRDPNVSYALSVRVVDQGGAVIKSHRLRFANRPTYLSTQIDVRHRGMDFGALGTRSKVNVGDLTGDGECDYLYSIDAQYKAAYDFSGRLLWEYEEQTEPLIYNSMATRLYDVDGDGRCEVVCLRDGRLCILDGRDGHLKRAIAWPHLSGRPTSLEARIFLANLRGQGPTDLLVLNGYANRPDVQLSAFTGDLEHLWDASGFFEKGAVGSHCLNVADVDKDGMDEVAFGTTMLDQDGQVLWRLPYQPLFSQGGGDSDHVDEAEIGDVDGDGRLEIFYASGTLLDAETGRPHFSRLAGVTNGQWVRIDKVRDDLPGRQLLLANKWSPPVLFDVRGVKLKWPFPFASWDLLDWNGDGETEVMGGGLICDRRGIVVGVCEPSWTMPQYGDVTGNGRQEVLPWCLNMHGQQIRVFSSAPRPQQRQRPYVSTRRQYNFRD